MEKRHKDLRVCLRSQSKGYTPPRYILFFLAVALWIPLVAWASEDGRVWSATQGEWTIATDAQGGIASLRDTKGHELIQGERETPAFAPTVSRTGANGLRNDLVPRKVQMAVEPQGVLFTYDFQPDSTLQLEYRIAFSAIEPGPVIRRTVTLVPVGEPIREDVQIRIGFDFLSSAKDQQVFVPRQDGLGDTLTVFSFNRWEFPLGVPYTSSPLTPEEHLAIPLLSIASSELGLRLTSIADPYYGSSFHLTSAPDDGAIAFRTGEIPLDGPVTRTFWSILHTGAPEQAMDAWYATALADVPAGPPWLHEVAWQHYDYLSDGGKGWFEDLDAIEKSVAAEDRGKIVFALHGWYDLLGRYTFDVDKNRLDDTWLAFPNAPAMKGKGFPTSEPVPMTRAELHRRIRYAKDRGVRVVLYFADGLTACEGAGRFAEDRLLAWGGWNGPDTVGKSYMQDPLNPEVYGWYVKYLRALLAEYGREIDGFVWDETFMIRAQTQRPEKAAKPAYVAPAMMRLVKELTQTTTAYNENLAFLASDCIGATSDEKSRWLDVPPYAIMAHGCYQDSHSRPSVWPYGLFPNYRNILWSCNWRAVENWGWTEFGVKHYGTPVATSNGWLDDQGIARLSDAQRTATLELFAERKGRPQNLQWLTTPAALYPPK